MDFGAFADDSASFRVGELGVAEGALSEFIVQVRPAPAMVHGCEVYVL